jgi:hypothetical protein
MLAARSTGEAGEDRFVKFEGLRTGGCLGTLTDVWELHCCDDCHEARRTLPGHDRLGCWFNAAAHGPVDQGLLETVFRDGEWRLVLTEDGAAAFGKHLQAAPRFGMASSGGRTRTRHASAA